MWAQMRCRLPLLAVLSGSEGGNFNEMEIDHKPVKQGETVPR